MLNQPDDNDDERQMLAAAALLADLPCRWAFCGGWAIDLFLGRRTRPHCDVDIAILRPDQLAVRAYLADRGWIFRKIVQGEPAPWPGGEFLHLPVHEVWGHHPTSAPSRLELLLNEAGDATFRFRRDATISLPLDRAILTVDRGLPVLAPEIVLLYKAKDAPAVARHAADFDSALPRLSPGSRAWLAAALANLHPAGHPWLDRLRD